MSVQIGLLTLFWVGAALTLFTTIAPLTDSAQWWVRGWEFPRVHIALVAVAVALLGLFLQRTDTAIAAFLLLACAGYQSYRVFPYTKFATPEIELRKDIGADDQITAVASNVLMENEDHQPLLDVLERSAPDIVFLMETDHSWVDRLADHLATYETVVRHPLDNHYGLVFATDLEVIAAEVVYLSDDDAPAVLAELIGPTGPFFFVGLHPKPPVPGHTTIERDEQIKRAALIADRHRLPVVAMGDFNDVGWSYNAERFKRYGEFRDPRVGRAMLPSFDARSWWMRFPIDQLYLTKGLDLISFDRLEPIGSDHFPMQAKFSVQQKKPPQ